MRGGISPITAKVTLEGPILKDKTSFVLGFRSTYSDWILQRIENPDIRNSKVFFYDVIANINSSINDKNKINAFVYNSGDKFTLISDIGYEYMNLGASASWKHIFNKRFYSDFKSVFSSYNLKVTNQQEPSSAYVFAHDLKYKELNASFIYIPNPKNEIKFGANSILYNINPGNYKPENSTSIYENFKFQNESAIESAIYIGDRYELTPQISIDAGLRFSIYNYLGPQTIYGYNEELPMSLSSITDTIDYNNSEIIQTSSGLDIRFGARYLINELNSVKFAYSRINQYLLLLSNSIAISPTDRWKLCDPYSQPITGEQFNLGYYRNIENTNLEASFEIYYKNNFNVPDFKNGADLVKNEHVEQDILSGYGRNYGLEFMIKKNHGKLTGWANYTYSKSELKFDGKSYQEKINNGSFYPANHDKPHNINFVSNYKLSRRLSFSTNFTYSTGRPTTLPVSKYFINDQPVIGYSRRNEQRIPDYWRIDLSINLEGNLKKRKLAHSFWMLSVYNLTGRKNAYSVFFNNEDGKIAGYKLSVYGAPIITLSYNFKLGNYASD